ncbi:type III polyketide synthase [Corallococcus sp. 4LFB]|uniref:type III polyketide synthase n=1 Tax=Corallococcus sp. 4LFB TaxID=3383249 RepID=UPI003976CC6E
MRLIRTTVPSQRYSQAELGRQLARGNAKIEKLFENSHIRYRNLMLPVHEDGSFSEETPEQLNARHRAGCLLLGAEAVRKVLRDEGISARDVGFLICVTTTGYLCPGLSALFVEKLGFRSDVRRLDIVGMGCNAALNALQNACTYAMAHPGQNVLMLCVEMCSAAYVHTGTMGNAVVNSLFGDGAAAMLVRANQADGTAGMPEVLDFSSLTLSDAIHGMRFEHEAGKLSFVIEREIPELIGANCDKPVTTLLARNGLKHEDIRHWVIHSGGKKVIDSAKRALGLSDHDVRHTLHILENFGNLSSGACLFSLARLLEEGSARPGDYGVLMAMGPGIAVETALLRW